MKHLFDLNSEQLLEIARHLKRKISEGLRAPDQEIHCLPTYIPNSDTPKIGRALVIDFGGTNVRAAVASLQDGELIVEKGPIAAAIPVARGKPLARKQFLASLADLVASLEPPPHLPVGYCFSYPAEATPDRDVRLLKWTKEVFVEDTVGEKMGSMLLHHLANYSPPVPCSPVTVINDTVASLLAGPEIMPADGYIGLIVGTGNNMATFMEAGMIPKLPESLNWKGSLPINLESGNFFPPYLNEWDNQLDADSENPGHQRFEKAVSGVYLAKLLQLAFPTSAIDPASGSKGVVKTAYHSLSLNPAETALAQQILERSAKLVAAALAGLIELLQTHHARKTVCITAEGGLFWGCPGYKEMTGKTLRTLLDALGLAQIAFDIVHIANANLLGSTVAALAK